MMMPMVVLMVARQYVDFEDKQNIEYLRVFYVLVQTGLLLLQAFIYTRIKAKPELDEKTLTVKASDFTPKNPMMEAMGVKPPEDPSPPETLTFAEYDQRVIQAVRRGSHARLSAPHSRGTIRRDARPRITTRCLAPLPPAAASRCLSSAAGVEAADHADADARGRALQVGRDAAAADEPTDGDVRSAPSPAPRPPRPTRHPPLPTLCRAQQHQHAHPLATERRTTFEHCWLRGHIYMRAPCRADEQPFGAPAHLQRGPDQEGAAGASAEPAPASALRLPPPLPPCLLTLFRSLAR